MTRREVELARERARWHVGAFKVHQSAMAFERNRGHFVQATRHAEESEWHRLAAKAHVKTLVRSGL